MLDDDGRATMTLRWETEFCPRCRDRTTFWIVRELVTRCSQCAYENDRSQGLGIDRDAL